MRFYTTVSPMLSGTTWRLLEFAASISSNCLSLSSSYVSKKLSKSSSESCGKKIFDNAIAKDPRKDPKIRVCNNTIAIFIFWLEKVFKKEIYVKKIEAYLNEFLKIKMSFHRKAFVISKSFSSIVTAFHFPISIWQYKHKIFSRENSLSLIHASRSFMYENHAFSCENFLILLLDLQPSCT